MMRSTRIIRAGIAYTGDVMRYLNIMYLRSAGMSIGTNCFISLHAKLDTRRGTIATGDGCEITHGCVILSHDASARRIDRTRGGQASNVRMGNNVFVGVNAVVLPDVTIGDNSIVGAGSIVTRDVLPNTVVAGHPVKIIRRLPEYWSPCCDMLCKSS